ncbi:MAG: hypothetical protein VYA30_13095 [Myxococcota bacterium]|nr:hypothetical protein [Myxococcota bacterium]
MDPKHTLLRIMTALMLLCFLSACGGQPTVRENMGQFNWNTGFGGGFVGYCQCGQTLWLFSVDRAERFDLSSKNGRLLKEQVSHWFLGANHANFERLECQSNAIRLRPAQAPSKPIYGQESPQTGWVGIKRFKEHSIRFPLGSGGTLDVSRQGWVIKTNQVVRDWRLKASGLIAATVDGGRVWAISDRALWRVDVNRRRMVSIALPSQLIQDGLSGLFMDGRVVWLRDRSNLAQPLDIRGHYAYPLAAPGKVHLASDSVKMPFGFGELKWLGPSSQLAFHVGQTVTTLNESVDSLLVLSAAHVMVSSGDHLELWHLGGVQPMRQGRFKMPGKTVALFQLEKQILALGEGYGMMIGAFKN